MKFYKEFNGTVNINGKRFLKGVAFSSENEFWELTCRVIAPEDRTVMVDGVEFGDNYPYTAEQISVLNRIFPNEPAYWPKGEYRGVYFDVHVDIDGYKSVSLHNGGDGYCGYLTDTVYSDGESGTWWNQFVWVPNSVSDEELVERIEDAY